VQRDAGEDRAAPEIQSALRSGRSAVELSSRDGVGRLLRERREVPRIEVRVADVDPIPAPSSFEASVDAAVATAAYDVISELASSAPERAPSPGRAGLLQTLSSQYGASLAAIDDGPFKTQGITVGHAAAEAMLEARENDGRFGPSQWVPNPAAGHWQPIIGPTGPILDPTPWVGGVKPFLIQSSSQFRPTVRARQPCLRG
jgi:hypothetical protein